MKRIIKTFLNLIIIIISVFLISCSSYENFKTVEIEGYGTMKVPENWELAVEEGFNYLYVEEDGERKNVLVECLGKEGVNEYFANVEDTVWIWDENYSNSAGISRRRIEYKDGSSDEAYVLYVTGDYGTGDSTYFICTDPSVEEKVLKKVTKSFEMFSVSNDETKETEEILYVDDIVVKGKSLKTTWQSTYYKEGNYVDIPLLATLKALGATVRIKIDKIVVKYDGESIEFYPEKDDFGISDPPLTENSIRELYWKELIVDSETANVVIRALTGATVSIDEETLTVYID